MMQMKSNQQNRWQESAHFGKRLPSLPRGKQSLALLDEGREVLPGIDSSKMLGRV
jgi:hypothetical protein